MNVSRFDRAGIPGRRPLQTAILALGVLMVVVGAAMSGAPAARASAVKSNPQVAALAKQVRTLQTQVTALQAQIKAVKKQDSQQWSEIGAGWESQDCLGAQMADLIQSTWGVIDQIGQAQPTPTTYFGPQTQVPDYNSCEGFSQPSVPRGGIQLHPTINPLLPLLKWIHG